MYPYEAMFLVDPNLYAEDADGLTNNLRTVLDKHGAKIQQLERWDERKLAYEIAGHRRGVYLLGYLEMPGTGVDAIQRELALHEWSLRAQFLRLDRDIPAYLEMSARYYDKIRQDQEGRRSRTRDEEAPERPKSEPAADVSAVEQS